MTRRVAGTPCLQISQDSSTRVQQGLVAEKNTTPMQNSEKKKKKKRVQEKKKQTPLQCKHSFKGNGCKLWMSRELPSPTPVSCCVPYKGGVGSKTHHLKIVEFLLDLLCQKRCQPVARCDFTTTVIFSAGPGVMKLNARAKHQALGCHWRTRGRLDIRTKVILTRNFHALSGPCLIVRRTGAT